MRALLTNRGRSVRHVYLLSRPFSSSSKQSDVKEATGKWMEAVNKAMPTQSPIVTALFTAAASPLLAPPIRALYRRLAEITARTTNQAVTQLREALSGALAPTNNSTLPLPGTGTVSTQTTQTTAADVYVQQFENWLRSQPPTKTCHEAANDLHAHEEQNQSSPKLANPSPRGH